jgi:hypothetical protein
MRGLLGLKLVVVLAGIVAVAVLFAPTGDLLKFWGSVGWLMFLVAINWLTSAFVFDKRASKRGGAPGDPVASLPAAGIVTFFYSLASLVALLLYVFNVTSFKSQLVSQIALLVVASVLVITLLLAAKGAEAGSESQVSKAQLITSLQRMQRVTEDQELKSQIQEQINYVSYVLPHPSKLNDAQLAGALQAIEFVEPPGVREALGIFKEHLARA